MPMHMPTCRCRHVGLASETSTHTGLGEPAYYKHQHDVLLYSVITIHIHPTLTESYKYTKLSLGDINNGAMTFEPLVVRTDTLMPGVIEVIDTW